MIIEIDSGLCLDFGCSAMFRECFRGVSAMYQQRFSNF